MENYQKLLYLWTNEHSLKRDIIYQGRKDKNILKLEAEIPSYAVFGFYSAYKFLYNDAPADYDHLYIYLDIKDLEKIKNRLDLPLKFHPSPNFFLFLGKILGLNSIKKQWFLSKSLLIFGIAVSGMQKIF